jgi:hypothetical protein
MDQLHAQVARARRRLLFEQFLGRLVWCLLVTLSLAAVAMAVPRVVAIEGLPVDWDAWWLVGSLGGGFLAAALWTLISPRTALDAAIEIDRRFELRERVASSLSLSPDDQASDAGRAVVNDAMRAVSRVELDDKFRVRLDRRAWWPLVPALAVFVLATFFDNRAAESANDPNSLANQKKQAQTALESLREKIAEQRKKAEERALTQAEDIFKQIEDASRDLTDKPDLDRTKAAVKLNDLAEQMEQRRQELGGKDELQKQLANMKDLGGGPAEKAAQAMKQGNWQQAKEEIEKLQKKLESGQLDEQAKKQLADQLQQMKDKLEAAVNARQQAMEDLKKQIAQQQQQGNLAKAGELQKKLDQLQKQQQQMDRLQQMAQQMAQMQQALKQGDAQQAAAAMAKMAEQLAQMQQDANEMQMLEAALDQLELAKDMMACQNCAGAGCAACQGKGNQFANMNMGGMGENMEGPPGMGMGRGRGIGPRPDEKNDTNQRDSQVRQQVGRGGAVFGNLVEVPNVKGEVAEQIKEQMANLGSEPADPLVDEHLPGSHREHAKTYFQAIRDGK